MHALVERWWYWGEICKMESKWKAEEGLPLYGARGDKCWRDRAGKPCRRWASCSAERHLICLDGCRSWSFCVTRHLVGQIPCKRLSSANGGRVERRALGRFIASRAAHSNGSAAFFGG